MPDISILLPHLREANNDAALKIALDCIVTHTTLDYELIVESVAARRDIYRVLNHMAARAVGNYILPHNSDVFVGPGWIEPLYDARDENTIVSPVMVECGAVGVNVLNHHHDFGMTPEKFDRDGFEAWVKAGATDLPSGERAWYFPSLLPRATFLEMGGFDTTLGVFPDSLDIDFWNRWEKSGRLFKRVASWVYHLQAWSFYEEQEKAVRHS